MNGLIVLLTIKIVRILLFKDSYNIVSRNLLDLKMYFI